MCGEVLCFWHGGLDEDKPWAGPDVRGLTERAVEVCLGEQSASQRTARGPEARAFTVAVARGAILGV